ncbi:hypothetical protein EL45_18195 [Cellulophaga sp. E6(2014)]|nr:hypothetical protein EL45_18195 [Cellulophaga sp. E6(2014)]
MPMLGTHKTYKQYWFRAVTNGLRIFIRSRNLWDFALTQKRKNKTKRFRYVRGGKQTLVCSRTVHSSVVVGYLKNQLNENKKFKSCKYWTF